MAKRSLIVSPKIMKEVDESQSNSLRVPADASQVGVGESAKYSWTEFVKVVDSRVTQDPNNDKVTVFQVRFRVPEDTPLPSENVGRSFSVFKRINEEALNAGDSADGQYQMSIISIGQLKSILRGAEYELEEGTDVNLFDYFAKDDDAGTLPPIIGAKMYLRMVDKLGKDKDKNPVRVQEPTKFVPESQGQI